MDSLAEIKEGCQLYEELSSLLKGAAMHPRKWLSNSSAVLARIPETDRASEINLEEGQLPSVKALGVLWLAEEDVFTFHLTAPEEDFKITKRSLLRKVASIFDPLGLVSPYVVRGKMLMQEVWASGIDWDDEVPEILEKKARDWMTEISYLAEAKVPRCIQLQEKAVSIEIHSFGDASADAHGAAIYTRVTYDSGMVTSRLIASKTKVAPLVATSIPKLEMMAILNLQLAQSVVTALKVSLRDVTFWSDSLNVLWWIRRPSRKLKIFIANRVGEIQSHTDPSQWRYIATKQNPADLPSRGVKAADLVSQQLWWRGPAFLLEHKTEWPENQFERGAEAVDEVKTTEIGLFTTGAVNLLDTRLDPTHHSSWLRLTRLHAWVQRFLENCTTSPVSRTRGELTAEEIHDAELFLIRQAQVESFKDEFTALKNGRELPKSSPLASLKSKLDRDQILRVDGRLEYAENLTFDAKHPIVLPRKHRTTQLIVQAYHEQGHHVAVTNQTLAALSAKYWIIRGREEVRDGEANCNFCKRRKARIVNQVVAPLPKSRVTQPLRAFTVTSVDYAGPFLTKQSRRVQTKRWLCLFTCHASRALHLEMAYSMNTDSFLNAFHRFVNRRGVPLEMTSDNGSNFVGANRELMELITQLDRDKIVRETAGQGVKWTFFPPLGPHFGGLHESLVKSAKRAIKAILERADITDEELQTAFTGAEALLNSRPLTYQSADARDEMPLTPNHFLHGQCGGQFAPEVIDTIDGTRFSPARRWRRVQDLLKHFWRRWQSEWLPLLQHRQKWRDTKKDLTVGTVVLVADPGSTRGTWPLGRITEVFPGKDGHTRVARIQVGEKTMLRPIVRLCPLEC
ncbi:uncharacterized protein LOC135493580 [Lineus longissimus]|uniref:uncharacterized protein LOC135493580 n=1 Tax=Lineus longissimus TaxID=88925 RepID=UPI00315C5EF8